MADFFASLGVFGWAVLVMAVFGLATLPQALREMWRRPWSKDKTRPSEPGETTD